MKSYILLRNNVETKPMNLEELQAMKLRPTDMVWVECQSWDWERPQDIPELKALLEGASIPAKPTFNHETHTLDASASKNQDGPGKKTTLKISQTIYPDEELIQLPKESSAVNEAELYKYAGLAATESTIKVEEEIKPVLPEPVSVNEKLSSTEQLSNDEPAVLQTNYSRSLDEIKEAYVKNMAEKKKKQTRTIPVLAKRAAVYIGFAIAGALLVVVIGRNSDKKIKKAPELTQHAPPVANKEQDAVMEPETQRPEEPVMNQQVMEPVLQEDEPVQRETIKPDAPTRNPESVEKTEIPLPIKTEQVLEPTPAKKISQPVDISGQVDLKLNDYVTGSFGGIRNLEVTLQNDSKYLLDEVKVIIHYKNLDNVIVNTENIVFHSIQPGQPSTIAVKKSRRGVKVEAKVIHIGSAAASYTAGF